MSSSFKNFNLPKFLFFLTLFFLPQQFGPHFWPAFSFVHGIRVDYLAPSLYMSDILIVLIFLMSAKNVLSSSVTKKLLFSPIFLLFLFILVIPLSYSVSPTALLYGLLKLFELLFLGFYTATQLKKSDIPTIIEIFAFIGILESLLAISQFFHQGSFNGFLYFLGERYYSTGSPGIALMNTAQGLMVRPYGTFPHPNVLAFFLFVSLVFASYGMHHAKEKLRRYLLLALIIIIEAGIFFTFSRAVILINIIFLLYSFGYITIVESKRKSKNLFFLGFLMLFIVGYLFLNNLRFLQPSSFVKDIVPRSDLINISVQAAKTYPLFGTGLNNFYYFEAGLQKNFSAVYLQPVHNIFLLIGSSVGLLGLALFLYFLTQTIRSAIRNVRSEKKIFSFAEIPLVLLLSIVFLGLFDHYFLTIQQGQLLFAFILGFSFSMISKQEA